MRPKWILAITLAFLILVVLIQNDQRIQMRFLFWHFGLSQILFLITAFAAGWLVGFFMGRRR